MRLAIIGFGKLGKAVGSAWEDAGGVITDKIISSSTWSASDLKCDVALECSTPDSAVNNIIQCINAGIPVVVGSTGWHHKMDLVEKAVNSNKGLVFHATNFSIGVYLLNLFSSQMAKTLNSFDEYSPSIEEAHHIHKVDKPSGTAITLKNKVSENFGPNDIPINSIREGEIIGTHELVWDSEIDQISIKHEAKNRKGFAIGAVKASKWVLNQKSKNVSGIFTMDDMIKELT